MVRCIRMNVEPFPLMATSEVGLSRGAAGFSRKAVKAPRLHSFFISRRDPEKLRVLGLFYYFKCFSYLNPSRRGGFARKYLMVKWIRAGLGLVLGLLTIGLAGCGGPAAEEAGVVRIGNGGEPRDLDPHTITGTPEAQVIFCLMEGLVTYHPTDDSIPYAGAAERWEVSAVGRPNSRISGR